MERLRQLAPWQITLAAVGAVLVFLVGGYFLVTVLTSNTPPPAAQSKVPATLDSDPNQEVLKELEAFEPPRSLPILTQPLQTPDPNSPSTVNPFTR